MRDGLKTGSRVAAKGVFAEQTAVAGYIRGEGQKKMAPGAHMSELERVAAAASGRRGAHRLRSETLRRSTGWERWCQSARATDPVQVRTCYARHKTSNCVLSTAQIRASGSYYSFMQVKLPSDNICQGGRLLSLVCDDIPARAAAACLRERRLGADLILSRPAATACRHFSAFSASLLPPVPIRPRIGYETRGL